MKKLFKRVSVLFTALMALSVSTANTAKEVKAAEDKTYTKITDLADVTEGEYVITYTATDKVYVFDGRDATNGYSTPTSYTATDLTISSKYSVNFIKNGNGFSIQTNSENPNNSSKYIYGTSGSNKLNFGSSAQLNTITTGKDTGTFAITSNTSILVFNSTSGQDRFRYYKSSTATGNTYKSVSLYKYIENTGGEDTPATPAELVEKGLNAVKNAVPTFFNNGADIELESTNEDGVNFTYELTDYDANVFAIDEDNLLSVNSRAALDTATLTITAELEGESSSVEVTLNSLKKDSTLTVAEALKAVEYYGTSESTDKYYISGRITSVDNETYGNVVIEDDTGSILVYGLYKDGVRYDAMDTKPIVGDDITVYGTLVNFGGNKPEVSGKPELISHTQNSTNFELIAMKDTSFALSFGYELEYRTEENEGAGEETTATLTFDANKANRTSYSTTSQVWSQNNITLTNNKSNSTNDVGDYTNPARFYKSSELIVEVPENYVITKIVFNSTSGYSAPFADATGADAVNNVITYVPATPDSNTYTIDSLSAQARLKSIEVSYAQLGGTVEILETECYGNVDLTFGASVDASLFAGYTVKGGILLDNADGYSEEYTLAMAYAAGSFDGVVREKSLTQDGDFYSVGTTIDIIDKAVTSSNIDYLEYEFVAAVYFTLTDDEGTSTTVVLNQKIYSVKSMVEYYVDNYDTLGLDAESLKVVSAFNEYIARGGAIQDEEL